MPEEAGQSDLTTATSEELIEELGKRCSSLVIGFSLMAEESRIKFRWFGNKLECIGLVELLRRDAMETMHPREEDDE